MVFHVAQNLPDSRANLLFLAISVRFITSKTKGLSSGNVLAD
jgi:hypothetical protein